MGAALFVGEHLLTLAIIIIAALAAGTVVLGPREGAGLRLAAGFAAWAQLLFALSLAGQLRATVIGSLVVAVTAAGLWLMRSSTWRIRTAAMAGAGVVPLFVLALKPPVAFDETLYHLPFVRAAAETGAVRFLVDARWPVFPQLQEMLCVPVLLFAGDTATHLVSLVELMATCLLLVQWGNRRTGRGGVVAAAIFAGSPLVLHFATVGYVDLALTLFVVAGFSCLDRDDPSSRRLLLAGGFLGTAVSVKYTAAFFAVAAVVSMAVLARRIKPAAVVAAGCAAAALPTTLWLVLTTGNPVFPFLSRVFGESPWIVASLPETPAGRLGRFLTLAWDVTFSRARVNQQPPVTPWLTVILALVVVAASRRSARAAALLAIAIVYAATFTLLPADSRYLTPLLALLALAGGEIVASKKPAWATPAAVAALLPGVLYLGYVFNVRGLPPLTLQAREQWLAARVPEYPTLMRVRKEPVYVCGAEQLKYYSAGRLLGDHYGPWSYERVLGGASGTYAIASKLRPIGIDYFLVSKRVCKAPEYDGGMRLIADDAGAQLWRVERSQSPP